MNQNAIIRLIVAAPYSIASSMWIGTSSGHNKNHCSSLLMGYQRSRIALGGGIRFYHRLCQ